MSDKSCFDTADVFPITLFMEQRADSFRKPSLSLGVVPPARLKTKKEPLLKRLAGSRSDTPELLVLRTGGRRAQGALEEPGVTEWIARTHPV